MNRYFISYGRRDALELARRLRDDLRAAGYSAWMDEHDVPGGGNWSRQIEAAIDHAHVTLALMSAASLESQWCRAEHIRSLRKGKRVIPLLVAPDTEPPFYLEHLNYLDFTDSSRYPEMFRDLLSDITSGQAFQASPVHGPDAEGESPYKPAGRRRTARVASDEKRNAPSFRRHIRALRQEPWLGARYWWPFFLFHPTDLQGLAEVLQANELVSPHGSGASLHTRWDRFVRLYFRPRTPDLYYAEGFRPAGTGADGRSLPIPAYLLFDLEAVVCHPESRFSDGDPVRTGKTYKTPTFFRELPFDRIYHDSWFMPDERDEIMHHREAQVIVPDRLGLEALQVIWLRSEAEYETLRELLPHDVWMRWGDKVTARADYHLFNHRWPYVQQASLLPGEIWLRFNPCQRPADCGPFDLRVHVTWSDGTRTEWCEAQAMLDEDLLISLPDDEDAAYRVRVTLDGELAYAGRCQPPHGIPGEG